LQLEVAGDARGGDLHSILGGLALQRRENKENDENIFEDGQDEIYDFFDALEV
jgi:hypothetical protein